jgi:hypothetical protein
MNESIIVAIKSFILLAVLAGGTIGATIYAGHKIGMAKVNAHIAHAAHASDAPAEGTKAKH